MFKKIFKKKNDSKLINTLKIELSDVLGRDISNIDESAEFASFNIDSFAAFNFISRLNSVIEDLPLTVFMECTTLKELEAYLIENHNDKIEELIALADKE